MPRLLPDKLYFRIGEVADIVGVEPHVLRYWETEFRAVRPEKSRKGQRVYSRRDVDTLLRVKELLYRHRYTIAGDDIRPSDPFSLHQYQGDVAAAVEPSSSVLAGLGSTATVIGGLGLLGGLFTTVFAYTDIIEDPIAKPVGVGVLVGGAALMTGGIVMLALSGTDVENAPRSNGKQARKPQYWRGEF